MKHLAQIFLLVFFLTSCSSDPVEQRKHNAAKEHISQTGYAGNKPYIDPVCKMPRDSSWTDYTIYKNDTLWFCSEGCKMAFSARPEKYIKLTH